MIFKDQLDREITLKNEFPKRIISLVPSQTELLFDLGLDEEVVGITKFCEHPVHWAKEKTRVGGTKTINFKTVGELSPDLIIANKEENERDQVLALSELCPTWISDVKNLEDALEMIRAIGKLCGRSEKAEELANEIEGRFNFFTAPSVPLRPIRVAYYIWRKPYMVAGGGTFINEMLRLGGFKNIFESEDRYPEFPIHTLPEANPEALFLSSEPFPFSEKHIEEFKEYCPDIPVLLVDGALMSWYGSRLLQTPAYLRQLRESLLSD